MVMYPGGPVAFLMGIWAAVASAVANRLTKRRVRAALLTGLLVSLWPQVEVRPQQHPLYQRGLVLSMRLMSPIYRFQSRRHHEDYQRERQEMIEHYGFDPATGEPPQPVTLLRVIPIAQTVPLESESLMMPSVESYAEGGRLLSDEAPEQPYLFGPRFTHTMPELDLLEARDDRGRGYQVMPGGGGGSDREWRFEFRSEQPLDAQARELILEVPEVRWGTFRVGHREPQVDRVVIGPWTFSVAL